MLKQNDKVKVIRDGAEIGKGIIVKLFYNRGGEVSHAGISFNDAPNADIYETLPIDSKSIQVIKA